MLADKCPQANNQLRFILCLRLYSGFITSGPESSMGALWVAKCRTFLGQKTKTLITLRGCADGFEWSLYAHADLYLLLNTGSSMLVSKGVGRYMLYRQKEIVVALTNLERKGPRPSNKRE